MKEPIVQAIVRATNALRSNKSTIALYWGKNNKLCTSRPESAQHDLRMKTFEAGLIGVYSKGVAYQDAVADIMTFY